MRISDWSSDVCSSDLRHSGIDMTSTIAERDGRWHVVIEGTDSQPVHKSFGSYGRAKAWQTRHPAARLRYAPEASAPNPFVDPLGDLLTRYHREVSSPIGRPTCRERVCQYV